MTRCVRGPTRIRRRTASGAPSGGAPCRSARRGFTLIELMLVVALIAIIAAISIPSLLNARIAANESSAVSTMRTLFAVNEQYRHRFGVYAPALGTLWSLGYLDASVADPEKAGYTFSYTSSGTTYAFNGDPTIAGQSGHRHFFVDSTGVIRFSSAGAASSTDSAIEGGP